MVMVSELYPLQSHSYIHTIMSSVWLKKTSSSLRWSHKLNWTKHDVFHVYRLSLNVIINTQCRAIPIGFGVISLCTQSQSKRTKEVNHKMVVSELSSPWSPIRIYKMVPKIQKQLNVVVSELSSPWRASCRQTHHLPATSPHPLWNPLRLYPVHRAGSSGCAWALHCQCLPQCKAADHCGWSYQRTGTLPARQHPAAAFTNHKLCVPCKKHQAMGVRSSMYMKSVGSLRIMMIPGVL